MHSASLAPALLDFLDNEDTIPPDPFFACAYAPATDRARAFVKWVIDLAEWAEGHAGRRLRVRRPADQAKFRAAVSAVACELAYRGMTAPEARTAVTLRKDEPPSRYRMPFSVRILKQVIDALRSPAVAVIDFVRGGKHFTSNKGRRSTIFPGGILWDAIRSLGLGLDDFQRDGIAGEVIVLRGPKDRPKQAGPLVDYVDDAFTTQARQEVRDLKAWIAAADIAYLGSDASKTDATDRRLLRIFNESFDAGGRLYGGFWMSLPSKARLDGLRIDGEPVASLDYSAIAPRIAYALAGATPAMLDLYDLGDDIQADRPTIKRVLNGMLCASSPIRRMDGVKEVKALTNRLEVLHAPLRPLFYAGTWGRLQRIESDLMVALLGTLRDLGILGLPIHDCLIVPASKVHHVRPVMEELAKEKAGADIPVKMELSGHVIQGSRGQVILPSFPLLAFP